MSLPWFSHTKIIQNRTLFFVVTFGEMLIITFFVDLQKIFLKQGAWDWCWPNQQWQSKGYFHALRPHEKLTLHQKRAPSCDATCGSDTEVESLKSQDPEWGRSTDPLIGVGQHELLSWTHDQLTSTYYVTIFACGYRSKNRLGMLGDSQTENGFRSLASVYCLQAASILGPKTQLD